MTGLLTISCLCAWPASDDRPCVVIVVGTAGAAEYKGQFERWAGSWKAAAGKAGAESIVIGTGASGLLPIATDCILSLVEKSKASREPLWIILIGHGTYDGREAKFNLQGPDVTDVGASRLVDVGQEACSSDQLCLG